MQHFKLFFWNADYVRVVSSSNRSGQSHIEYISLIAFLKVHIFTALSEAADVVHPTIWPLNPTRVSGGAL